MTERANSTAADAICAAFRRHGVTHAFGQSIPVPFHLAAPSWGIKQVAYRAENAGGAMADGYARISGRVGVVTAQNGPAATLLVPPLAEALKASIPVLALVQDVARDSSERNAFQELDHLALFAGVTKWVKRVDHSSRLADYVDMAFTAACSGRPGPVALIVPADMFHEPLAVDARRGAALGSYPLDRPVADPAQVAIAARLLAEAERPLVVAGGGVHLSRACDALAALQSRAHLPVATTTMGKGAVAETDPLSLGVIGYYMGPNGMARHLRPLVERADVVLLVGSRTNQNGTDSWQLLPRDARYIHIDADGLEIGRNYEALRLVGDARATLEALSAALSARDLGKRRGARPAVEAAIAAGRARHADESRAVTESGASPIRPERLMRELAARLRPDDIVVADASYASIWIANYLRAERPGQRFLTPRGIAGLGWGLPMALGAKVAAPDARVFCIAGDGGFAHCWAELETARRMGLPVVTMVLNNGILGYQKHAELSRYGRHSDAVAFAGVDHALIARACGCHGERLEDPARIGAALDAAIACEVPSLIDVVTDPAAYPPITSFAGSIEKFV
ncbi:MAG: acetolactate synthase catalytic subunit [Alphaproteobacteria bacterium]|nr:acetolactate synthase catalytic subunit [Alphaproteobacteria bacterium]